MRSGTQDYTIERKSLDSSQYLTIKCNVGPQNSIDLLYSNSINFSSSQCLGKGSFENLLGPCRLAGELRLRAMQGAGELSPVISVSDWVLECS